jgi:hypothetical protein
MTHVRLRRGDVNATLSTTPIISKAARPRQGDIAKLAYVRMFVCENSRWLCHVATRLLRTGPTVGTGVVDRASDCDVLDISQPCACGSCIRPGFVKKCPCPAAVKPPIAALTSTLSLHTFSCCNIPLSCPPRLPPHHHKLN